MTTGSTPPIGRFLPMKACCAVKAHELLTRAADAPTRSHADVLLAAAVQYVELAKVMPDCVTDFEAYSDTATEPTRIGCTSTYVGPQGWLECDREALHNGEHTASIPTDGPSTGTVGWDDAEQDGTRCPVTVPKPCVLEIRHPGNHRSNSGTEWPALFPKPTYRDIEPHEVQP